MNTWLFLFHVYEFYSDTELGKQLIGERGRLRIVGTLAAKFFYWICLVSGSMFVGWGIYESIQELRKPVGQPKEWSRPGWLMFIGAVLASVELFRRMLAATFLPDGY